MVIITASELMMEETLAQVEERILKLENSITKAWKDYAKRMKRDEIESFLKNDFARLEDMYKYVGILEEALEHKSFKVVSHAPCVIFT